MGVVTPEWVTLDWAHQDGHTRHWQHCVKSALKAGRLSLTPQAGGSGFGSCSVLLAMFYLSLELQVIVGGAELLCPKDDVNERILLEYSNIQLTAN